MIDKIMGRKTRVLEKALDASWLRNETIAQNLANVDTPGYKRMTVSFEEHLVKALDSSIEGIRTHKRHIPIGKSGIDTVPVYIKTDNSRLSVRQDGNNVDIDNEMASMAKNSLKYNLLIQSINSGFNRIKSVISGGGR
jgi:flagellar basal-body rod protein FlgB